MISVFFYSTKEKKSAKNKAPHNSCFFMSLSSYICLSFWDWFWSNLMQMVLIYKMNYVTKTSWLFQIPNGYFAISCWFKMHKRNFNKWISHLICFIVDNLLKMEMMKCESGRPSVRDEKNLSGEINHWKNLNK